MAFCSILAQDCQVKGGGDDLEEENVDCEKHCVIVGLILIFSPFLLILLYNSRSSQKEAPSPGTRTTGGGVACVMYLYVLFLFQEIPIGVIDIIMY